MAEKRLFGIMPDGTEVWEITLRAGALSCSVLTYGGALRTLKVTGADGVPVDVVLGYDRLEDYAAQTGYVGALVGRYANRIGGSRFVLNGVDYPLFANDGNNHLHGGRVGFDKRVWSVEEETENRLCLSLVSPDGEEGYPGTLRVRVTYVLEEDGLRLCYEAVSDADTLCNLTSHAYFNLAGHSSGSITGHRLCLHSAAYVPTDGELIPLGRLEPVEGTPMDFRRGQKIGSHIAEEFDQLTRAGGYDHTWVIDGDVGTLRPAAEVFAPETGIVMSVETTLPGVQLYTGNVLAGGPVGKGGAVYGKWGALCLESHFYPNSPNWPEVPQAILPAGAVWRHETRFRFGILNGGNTNAERE